MYFDLNVPVPIPPQLLQQQSKKGKEKAPPTVSYTLQQITAIEARIDILAHLGYTVVGLNQTVYKKVDPKTHVNILDILLERLKKRPEIMFVKRLTIILDEDSEKGFGLSSANASIFTPYDLIALTPITATAFSLACQKHSEPSPLTAHVISPPLTLPRLPFRMKHTMIGVALKNGAVFEINFAGALGVDSDGGGGGSSAAKKNWWAAAREVVRATKGKGLILSGGVMSDADLRAPRDIGNIATLLGMAQDAAHEASTKTPKSLLLRAQTRKTYRAVFSEPRVIIPDQDQDIPAAADLSGTAVDETASAAMDVVEQKGITALKRPREDGQDLVVDSLEPQGAPSNKKKRKKNKAVGVVQTIA